MSSSLSSQIANRRSRGTAAWQRNTRPRENLDWKCPAELVMPEPFDFLMHHHQLVAPRP